MAFTLLLLSCPARIAAYHLRPHGRHDANTMAHSTSIDTAIPPGLQEASTVRERQRDETALLAAATVRPGPRRRLARCGDSVAPTSAISAPRLCTTMSATGPRTLRRTLKRSAASGASVAEATVIGQETRQIMSR